MDNYLSKMTSGIIKYKELKNQLETLEQQLLDEQEMYEDCYFADHKNSMAIIDYVRQELIKIGL